ncbi:hypothetical protein [Natranaerobius thermophilus]|uniref:Lipoprotein n=1 Tax=Natranaerobius thermophilus (strain ATCC BAA-1301 / DSM 18059 / JW/NM-WN-LF) TaxID=457570 RepID=B2A125_NATTJ|nr:hypothetical protein [Natranaerobius thermophilus]ACB84648.1 hypothetical protein Nther_1064 [Natranaerobius thermophilus JW/NM-WN-LF]
MRILTLLLNIFIVITGFIGCTEDVEEISDDKIINLEQVETAIENEGLDISIIEETSPEEISISHDTFQIPKQEEVSVSHEAYQINEGKEKIYIYEFDTIKERKEYFPDNLGGFSVEGDESTRYSSYATKNVAIIYELTDVSGTEILETTTKLGEAVFYNMHETKNKKFQGEGDYWDINFDMEFFEYQWEDEKGDKNLEFFGYYNFELEYLDQDPEEVSEIALEYSFHEHYGSGSSASTKDGSSILEDESFYNTGGHIDKPIEKEKIKTTVKWFDKEEEIDLKEIN